MVIYLPQFRRELFWLLERQSAGLYLQVYSTWFIINQNRVDQRVDAYSRTTPQKAVAFGGLIGSGAGCRKCTFDDSRIGLDAGDTSDSPQLSDTGRQADWRWESDARLSKAFAWLGKSRGVHRGLPCEGDPHESIRKNKVPFRAAEGAIITSLVRYRYERRPSIRFVSIDLIYGVWRT